MSQRPIPRGHLDVSHLGGLGGARLRVESGPRCRSPAQTAARAVARPHPSEPHPRYGPDARSNRIVRRAPACHWPNGHCRLDRKARHGQPTGDATAVAGAFGPATGGLHANVGEHRNGCAQARPPGGG
jgi:hypothetical protein